MYLIMYIFRNASFENIFYHYYGLFATQWFIKSMHYFFLGKCEFLSIMSYYAWQVKFTHWQTLVEQLWICAFLQIHGGKWQTFNRGHGFYIEKATDRGLLHVRCIWTSSQVLLLTTNVGKVCLCMIFYKFYKRLGRA